MSSVALPEARRRQLSCALVRNRWVSAAIASVLVMAACSGEDDAVVETTTPVTSSDSESTSTSAAPSTTEPVATTAVVSAPGTTTTLAPSTVPVTSTLSTLVTVTTVDDTPPTTQAGEPDWVAIVQGLSDALGSIEADPDVERIGEFCVDVASPCRDLQGAQIEALVRDGWRIRDAPRVVVVSATLNTTADGLPPTESSLIVLDVELAEPAESLGQIVDDAGNVLFELTPSDSDDPRQAWFIRREAGGQWRVFETV